MIVMVVGKLIALAFALLVVLYLARLFDQSLTVLILLVLALVAADAAASQSVDIGTI
jgi:hypothetical protein